MTRSLFERSRFDEEELETASCHGLYIVDPPPRSQVKTTYARLCVLYAVCGRRQAQQQGGGVYR